MQSTEFSYQTIRLLFINGDNLLNRKVIEAFFKCYGISVKASETKLSNYRSANICHTKFRIDHLRLVLETFDFTYQFHGTNAKRQGQVNDVVELIKNFVIDYVFCTFELNELQVFSEGMPRQRSTGESIFYYLTDSAHTIRSLGQLLTGPDSIFAGLLPGQLKKIRGVVIYGYMEDKFQHDLKVLTQSALEDIQRYSSAEAMPEIVLLDTSIFFTKASQEEFQADSLNHRIKASPRIRDEYSNLISGLIYQWFEALRQSKEKVSELGSSFDRLFVPSDYFNLNNLDMAFYVKALNQINKSSEWKIGGNSFFITNFQGQKEKFLINVPFRDYRHLLDQYIVDKEITQFFYEDFNREKGQLVEKRYLFYEYAYDYKGVNIQLLSEPQTNSNDQNKKLNHPLSQMMLTFLPFAHATVFYEPEVGKNLQGCKVQDVSSATRNREEETIQLFCFFTKMQALNYNGLLISYLWRRRKPEKQTGRYVADRGAVQFYNLLLPQLEARMRDSLVPILQNQTLYFARQVAITRVFSRNFSHHMGSHIHPRTKAGELESRLYELLGDQAAEPQVTRHFVNWLRDYYSDYVTARNEFVADPLQSSKNVPFYQGLILPFVENTLVMDNLAASEGVCYRNNEENRLKIFVRYRGVDLKADYELSEKNLSIREALPEGRMKISYPEYFPYFVDLSRTTPQLSYREFYANKKLEIKRDPMVSIPHEHAFFSLLENAIRNIAKHQKKDFSAMNSSANLEIMIEVSDRDQFAEHYTVDLYDNISRLGNADEWNRFRDRINTELVKPDTLQPANENLGLLDMKICAAMLAGRRDLITNWGDTSESPLEVCLREGERLITHQIWDDKEINWADARINYRFKIQKARRICYIGQRASNNEDDWQNWAKEGLFVFETPEAFLEQNERTTASYGFAIIDEEAISHISDKKLDQVLFKLPFKALVNPSVDSPCPLLRFSYFNKRIQRTTTPLYPDQLPVKKLLEKCWRQWIQRFSPLDNTILIIHREHKSQDWEHAAAQFDAYDPPFKMILNQQKLPIKELVMDEQHTYVLYDHHGRAVEKYMDYNSPIGFLRLRQTNNAHLAYDITSRDYSKIAFPRFPKPEEEWLFPYELLQSGLLRILIIDERFSEYAHKPAEGNIGQQFKYAGQPLMGLRNFDLCWANKVFIATHVDFYGSGRQQLSGKIKYGDADHTLTIQFDGNHLSALTSFYKEDPNEKREINFDFVILHRTLLSKSQWLNGRHPKDFVRSIREHIPYVVLESGGNNHIFDETIAKFMSFSELSSFFNNKSVSKLSLVQRLTSLIT